MDTSNDFRIKVAEDAIKRLDEMFHVVRDIMVVDPGHLLLYFMEDWTPVTDETLDEIAGEDLWFSDHVTFGHDIETSFLLSQVLY